MRDALKQLRQLAGLHGIQAAYQDVHGRRKHASAESLLAVLRGLGVPLDRLADVPAALEQCGEERSAALIDPVLVAWEGRLGRLRLGVPSSHATTATFRLVLETGEAQTWEARLQPVTMSTAAAALPSEGPTASTVAGFPPGRLPLGYHRLQVSVGERRGEALLLAAPQQAYAPAETVKQWGLFAPLYALRSEANWGAGNFSDLATLGQWTAAQGGNFVATLPLLAAFLDSPCEYSPYAPASRLGWNPFYVDVDRVPELEQAPALQQQLASREQRQVLDELRRGTYVDYRQQMQLMDRLLRPLSELFFAQPPNARRQAFAQYLEEHPAVDQYAKFRATMECQGSVWNQWPSALREGHLTPDAYATTDWQYHAYAQWLAETQLADVDQRFAAQGMCLYLDLPLGVHRDGYDTWRYRDSFALNVSGGAPPDAFFTHGQNWGFPPLHPQRQREQGYEYLIAVLRHHMRRCGVLRIDHVMQLHRLYWVPEGFDAKSGAYVKYPAEELYALLTLESHRHKCLIVGENLGTVPKYVNDSLSAHRLRTMYVAQFSFREDASRPLAEVPQRCVASVNTHDMATFAAYWKEGDLKLLEELDLLDSSQANQERAGRKRIREALRSYLCARGAQAPEDAGLEELLDALHQLLSASSAERVLVNLEDLWLEEAPQNTPGTGQERPNWQRKMRVSLEELQKSEALSARLSKLARDG